MKLTQAQIRLFSLLLKVVIVSAALFYLVQHTRLSELKAHFGRFVDTPFITWLSVLLLLPVNWSLEALKWKLLVKQLQPIRFHSALLAVLAGVTAGTATPNRIGESAGRIFLLRPDVRIAAFGLTAAGSAAQLIVTVLAASIGLVYSRDVLVLPAFRFAEVLMLLSLVVVGAVIFIGLMYRSTKGRALVTAVLHIGTKTAIIVLLLSALRYLVYVVQFVLLLRAAGIHLELSLLFAAVSVTYGLITLIPTFAFTEIVVRGSASAAVIGQISGNEPAALSAALVLWVVNVGLPAIIGIWPVLQLRFFKADEQ